MGDGVGDGPPDVDDADASLEETLSIFAEVPTHSGDASIEGLVDVDALLQKDRETPRSAIHSTRGEVK